MTCMHIIFACLKSCMNRKSTGGQQPCRKKLGDLQCQYSRAVRVAMKDLRRVQFFFVLTYQRPWFSARTCCCRRQLQQPQETRPAGFVNKNTNSGKKIDNFFTNTCVSHKESWHAYAGTRAFPSTQYD